MPAFVTLAAKLLVERVEHTATLLHDGRVLIAGGVPARSPLSPLADSEVYDPRSGQFAAAVAMNSPRLRHTATLLRNGKVLIAGGVVQLPQVLVTDTAELYDTATGAFASAGLMHNGRSGHTATLLDDGRVLLAGGDGPSGRLLAAEVYDPVSGTFEAVGAMSVARASHTATLLPDGRVLVAAGRTSSGALVNSAELYDPLTQRFSPAGALAKARSNHSATLLPSGQVLVAGGWPSARNEPAIAEAELYDPLTNTFSAGGTMVKGTLEHTATLLPDGQVLLLGMFTEAELYNPASRLFTRIDDAPRMNRWHTATLLSNGKVLLLVSLGPQQTQPAVVFESRLDSFSRLTAGMSAPRIGHTATPLPDGRVLLAGGGVSPGKVTATAEIFETAFAPLGPMSIARHQHTATLLPDGRVLIAGGITAPDTVTGSVEFFDPEAGTFISGGAMTTPRFGHSATLLASGRVLFAGGATGPGIVGNNAEVFDPATGRFTPAASTMSSAHYLHTATLLADGRVLVVGGWFGGAASSAVDLYDPVTDRFIPLPGLAEARFSHTATLLPDGSVLIAGGNNTSGASRQTERFDPRSERFAAIGPMSAARFGHCATLLGAGQVLLSGGFSSFGETITAELYDPETDSFTPPPVLGMTSVRNSHAATLLPGGEVLLTGGVAENVFLSSAEMFVSEPLVHSDRRPVIVDARVSVDARLTLAGSGFHGISEGSNGATNQASSAHPIVRLQRIDNDQIVFAFPAADRPWSGAMFESRPLTSIPAGHYRVSVFANGISSRQVIVSLSAR